MGNKPRSLYVHVPFCLSICPYCDFPKVVYKEEWAQSYLTALFREISSFGIEKGTLTTIYVGGGTPTSLTISQLESLLAFLFPFLAPDGEFTVEGNPESLDFEKLRAMKERGVNRLSIGFQSSNDGKLAFLGRHHSFGKAKEALELAREAGFVNISGDFMYGIPGERVDDALNDLRGLLSLGLPHVSAYSLIVEPNTKFKLLGYQEGEEELLGEMLEKTEQEFEKWGYRRYEVSNYSKDPSFESRHNKAYWENLEYYGAGVGASGFLSGRHYKNTASLGKYLEEGPSPIYEDPVTEKEKLEYFLLTMLRLKTGFSLERFLGEFGFPFEERYGELIGKYEKNGLALIEDGRFHLTSRGLNVLDSILLDLF